MVFDTVAGDGLGKAVTTGLSDFFSQSLLTAQVWKGILVAAGLSAIGSASANSTTVRSMAGLQYLMSHEDFFFYNPARIESE